MATPFKISMIAALGSPNGPRRMFPLTCTDVANAYALFASGDRKSVV